MGDSNRLPPGFRFHPTDEELVCYYLRRRSSKSKPIRSNVIADIDLYKHEPSDLPAESYIQTGDRQWFFFTQGHQKYPNGSRKNRATEYGYWKTTGKDRPVLSKAVIVGMKKTLVFYRGRAPRGVRTNWVMHEYRLVDDQIAKDSFVVCRIFMKSGPGPRNGEQYGALYQEENSTASDYQCTSVAENEQNEETVLSSAKEVEVQGRDSLLGPFTSALEQDSTSSDDDLQKFLLECLNEPDDLQDNSHFPGTCSKDTIGDLLQIQHGVTRQSNLVEEPFAGLADINTLDDELNILEGCSQQIDQKLDAERIVHGIEPMHEANNYEHFLDFQGLSSPPILAGDFIELNDLLSPLSWTLIDRLT